jgi:predicted outer membrane protein
MKRIAVLPVLAIAAVVAGCGGEAQTGSTNPLPADRFSPDAVVSPASASGTGASPATNGTSAADPASTLAAAYREGNTEAALSQLAVNRASNEEARQFAQRMAAAHAQSNDEIRQFAAGKGIALSTQTAEEDRTLFESLAGRSGNAFDQLYINHNAMALERSVALFRAQAVSGADLDVRTLAGNMLPAVQAHLFTARTIAGKLDADVFLMNAYSDGLAAIRLGMLALQRSGNAGLRQHAQETIDVHAEANRRIAAMAQARNVLLPVSPAVEHQGAEEDLVRITGKAFDKTYMSHSTLLHAGMVSQAMAHASRADVPGGTANEIGSESIKVLASDLLPRLQQHWRDSAGYYQAIEAGPLLNTFHDSMGEVLLARLALQKSASNEVRQFAQRMIGDHTAASNVLLRLAAQDGLTLPREIPADQFHSYTELSHMNGADFDLGYLARSAEAHGRQLSVLAQPAAGGGDPGMQAYAAGVLPMLRSHLDEARQIRERLAAAQ